MGNLKSKALNKKIRGKEHDLTAFEMNFIKALVINRNAAYNQYQAAIQSFISYVAGSKWGYEDKDLANYFFEVNAEKGTALALPKDEVEKAQKVAEATAK